MNETNIKRKNPKKKIKTFIYDATTPIACTIMKKKRLVKDCIKI